MVLPPSHKIPRVSCYSGYPPLSHRFVYRNLTFYVSAFQLIQLTTWKIMQVHTPVYIAVIRFGLFRVRSPLLTESHFVFSSWGYLDVSVPLVSLHYAMYSRNDTYVFTVCGFPHSEICASSVICTYTQLFAACHVLLRLPVPGHPPCALSSLTFVYNQHFTLLFSEIFSVKDWVLNPKSINLF